MDDKALGEVAQKIWEAIDEERNRTGNYVWVVTYWHTYKYPLCIRVFGDPDGAKDFYDACRLHGHAEIRKCTVEST